MKTRRSLSLFLLLLITFLPPTSASGLDGENIFLPMVLRGPVWDLSLKWKNGGCYTYWCETAWYSSPAVVDINGDGKNEVIAGAYSLFALNGETGALIWRRGTTDNRIWPGIVAADLNRDGTKEIVIAQEGGFVTAYTLQGGQIWRKQPAGDSGELKSLLVADLDGNGSALEVVVSRAADDPVNTWVLEANGSTRPGWPQLATNNGYASGVFNANAAAGNISGDGRLELIVPSDMHYINAYAPDGSPLRANAADYPNKFWGQVGVWESLEMEKQGGEDCNGVRARSYRANFDDGPAVISDVDGDGRKEVVATGSMYDCTFDHYPNQYIAPFIFNPDRSRFNSGGYDWRQNPINTGAPLREDWRTMEFAETNPAVADIDGDGKKEILFASFDGRMHAFWLDKTEHGAWPFAVTQPGEGVIRFASEPVIADLNNDGTAEIIFTSWTEKGSNKTGKVHLLDWTGRVLKEVDLPPTLEPDKTWNGGLGAPTLANIDADADLELIILTAKSGVVVYDLPGSANARVLWGTGRGNFHRDGTDQ